MLTAVGTSENPPSHAKNYLRQVGFLVAETKRGGYIFPYFRELGWGHQLKGYYVQVFKKKQRMYRYVTEKESDRAYSDEETLLASEKTLLSYVQGLLVLVLAIEVENGGSPELGGK